LGIHNRLVASVFGDLELLDQSEHLRAWLHVVVVSAPSRDRPLAKFLDLPGDGLFALLERRKGEGLSVLELRFVALIIRRIAGV
jgi:hypothetical protein